MTYSRAKLSAKITMTHISMTTKVSRWWATPTLTNWWRYKISFLLSSPKAQTWRAIEKMGRYSSILVKLSKSLNLLLFPQAQQTVRMFSFHLLAHSPMGPFACPIRKRWTRRLIRRDSWQVTWRGVGVDKGGWNIKSTAFALKSRVLSMEVHTPIYWWTAKQFIPQYSKKTRKKNTMVKTLNLYPFKIQREQVKAESEHERCE